MIRRATRPSCGARELAPEWEIEMRTGGIGIVGVIIIVLIVLWLVGAIKL